MQFTLQQVHSAVYFLSNVLGSKKVTLLRCLFDFSNLIQIKSSNLIQIKSSNFQI